MNTNNNTQPTTQYETITKYDRLRGGLEHVALWTKPSTIQTVDMTGKAQTYVMRTARYEENGGDFLFAEVMDETGVTRVCFPPKVCNVIAAQRDSLTKRRRSAAGKKRAADDKANGILPGFMRNPKPHRKKVQAAK